MALMPLPAKRRSPYLTTKQMGILKALVKRNPDGTLLDVHQLVEAVAPGTTRGAMICSLRHLAAHGLVCEDELVIRRSRKCRTLTVTPAGLELVRPSALPTAVQAQPRTP